MGVALLLPVVVLLWFRLTLPDPLFDTPYATVLEDRNGELLGARIADDGQWRFPSPEAVPDRFETALLLFEDRYFYRHPGVNPVAIARALKSNFSEGRVVSGGSTLTMQVVRLSRGNPTRTIREKIREMFVAMAVEMKYSKAEILNMYATHAPFGGNVVGLEAASWRYYGRAPDLLTWAESTTLAVLPNSPALIFPGRNQELLLAKRNRLLDRLLKAGAMDTLSHSLALTEPLPGPPMPLPMDAPHLLDRAIAEGKKGTRIRATLDAVLQRNAVRVAEEHRARLAANQVHNLSAMIVDIRTGGVLAYIGNTGPPTSRGTQVDVLTAPRSPGSSLKPFLYFLQLNEGNILPKTLLTDIPTHFAGYSPRNFNLLYDGAVPADRALARSLNVPFVRSLRQYGYPRFHFRLQQMGFTTLRFPPDHYGLALILGGAEITAWDLAGAYTSMAMTLQGYDPVNPETLYWKNARLIYDKQDLDAATYDFNFPVHPSTIWETFNAMQDLTRPEDEANWQFFTSARRLAWKTGTSFGFRDGWSVGLNADHLVAVWAGNADGEGRPGLTGIGTAAPAMFGLFHLLGDGAWFREPVFDFAGARICPVSGHLAGPDCDGAVDASVPKPGLETSICPYHRGIHLDSEGRHRVHSGCYQVADMQAASRFVLPAVQEWYYRQRNTYQSLPPWLPGCSPEEAVSPLDLIYPDASAVIYVPVEIDGSIGSTVFEAAHRTPGTRIWWHLNDNYLGETRTIHQIELAPEPGMYQLTLVDENGERVQRVFQVLPRQSGN